MHWQLPCDVMVRDRRIDRIPIKAIGINSNYRFISHPSVQEEEKTFLRPLQDQHATSSL